jgi:hypothetical protein
VRSAHLTFASLALALTCAACTESPTSPSSASGSATAKQSTTGSSSTTTATGTTAPSSANGFALHFTGSAGGDDDGRVKIQIDPHVPADVGADFTIEFWMKTEPAANTSISCQAGEDGWRYGNVILDRSLASVPVAQTTGASQAGGGLSPNVAAPVAAPQGSYGLSLSGGRIAFGVSTEHGSQTVCGLMDVADGRWHHIAATRRSGDGQLRVYVDGTESAQGHGPLGDVSYRNGRAAAMSLDPYLLLGGAKPVTSSPLSQMPAFSGWIDDLRLSTRVRYFAPFDRPVLPFAPDADTALLYHFDEGPAGPCTSGVMDGSGNSAHGICRAGGVVPGPIYETDSPFATLSPSRVTTKSWLQD